MKNEIDVSVCVISYFHEKTIRRALESILAQKTQYNYEIVISDDCSKDGTIDILKEYGDRYPELIRLNLNNKNLGIPQNLFLARCLCRGKYIVVLSGDDYWIDDSKIQTQVAFLNEHQEYYAVCNCTKFVFDDDTENPISIQPPRRLRNREYTLKDYEEGVQLSLDGCMMRNSFLTEEGRNYFRQSQRICDKADDSVDYLLILLIGKFYVLDYLCNAHTIPRSKKNKHNYNSLYSAFDKDVITIETYNNLYIKFRDKVNFRTRYENLIANMFLRMVVSKKKREYVNLLRTIPQEYKSPLYKSVYLTAVPKTINAGKYHILRKIRQLR